MIDGLWDDDDEGSCETYRDDGESEGASVGESVAARDGRCDGPSVGATDTSVDDGTWVERRRSVVGRRVVIAIEGRSDSAPTDGANEERMDGGAVGLLVEYTIEMVSMTKRDVDVDGAFDVHDRSLLLVIDAAPDDDDRCTRTRLDSTRPATIKSDDTRHPPAERTMIILR